MEPVEEKVVKCKSCDLFFGHSEKKTKCPFCRTEYREVGGKVNDLPAGRQGKKEAAKTQKESFKVWK